MALPRVGARLRRVRSPSNIRPIAIIPVPGPSFTLHRVGLALRANLAASRELCSRVGTRLRLALHHRRARRSHAPTLDAARIARSAIPTSNNATPRSGDTTPSQPYSSQPVPLISFSVLCTLSCPDPNCFGIHFFTFPQAVGRFAPLHCLPSPSLCPPPFSRFPQCSAVKIPNKAQAGLF